MDAFLNCEMSITRLHYQGLPSFLRKVESHEIIVINGFQTRLPVQVAYLDIWKGHA
jgi:hypothetical protein